ncbi:MAG: uracil-DNA glycosylase family protein [Gemmatimonadota bacterium]
MTHPFDPGCAAEPFRALASEYPGTDVYPPGQFRVEWGPIFHRGRLDGSARVLVIGQDPAQHETVIRRILVGEAGRRLQGLLAKLGITTSYVLINTYLFSVYGSVKAKTRKDPRLITYRNQWLDALLLGSKVEAVVALGTAAAEAWQFWKATPNGAARSVGFAAVTHPTQPESSSGGVKVALAAATKKMLQNWNAGLTALAPSVQHPDQPTALALYGDAWADGDRIPIPEADMPPGLPGWMYQNDGWAQRAGKDLLQKRRNITITIPKGIVA